MFFMDAHGIKNGYEAEEVMTSDLEYIEQEFNSVAMAFFHFTLDAERFGSPCRRTRIYMVGVDVNPDSFAHLEIGTI